MTGPASSVQPDVPGLVALAGVSFGYDAAPVLQDVSVIVKAGAFTGIVGPSGSGKTSLLRVLLGTLTPQHGVVTRTAGTAVSYVPQLDTVDWNFPVTVEQCVLMSRRQQRWNPRATRSDRIEVRQVLDRLGIAELAGRHIRALSGGQQQRMFLARALLRGPQLLLLDEPTSGVDVQTRHEVLHLLDDLNQDGLAVVLTTHDLNGIAAHLPHLIALQRRVIASGPPEQVIVPDVLEQVFGARLEVLQHLGMPVVLDTADQLRPLDRPGRVA